MVPGMVLRHCARESTANKIKHLLLWGGGKGAAVTYNYITHESSEEIESKVIE